MASGAPIQPNDEALDSDDDNDLSEGEDDYGELADAREKEEEALIDYLVQRNEEEATAGGSQVVGAATLGAHPQAKRGQDDTGKDSLSSVRANPLAAELIKGDRTHHGRPVLSIDDFLPPVGTTSTAKGRKEGLIASRKYRRTLDQQLHDNRSKLLPKLDRSKGPLRLAELPSTRATGRLPLFDCDTSTFLKDAIPFGAPNRPKRPARGSPHTELSRPKKHARRDEGEAEEMPAPGGEAGEAEAGAAEPHRGVPGGGRHPDDDDDDGDGDGDGDDDDTDGDDTDEDGDGGPPDDDPNDPDYNPDDNDDGASNDDCEEEPDEMRQRAEHDLHGGADDAAAGHQPYEIRRTLTSVGVVIAPASRPPSSSFVSASTIQAPHIHMDYRTDRWSHASQWNATSSVVDEIIASFPATDSFHLNLISSADAAANTRVGHSSNDYFAWQTFGEGSAGFFTLLAEAVASSDGTGRKVWHMSLLFDGDVIDEYDVRTTFERAGWKIGWKKGRIAVGTGRRRLLAWRESITSSRTSPIQTEQARLAFDNQFKDAGRPYSLYQPGSDHPLLGAIKGDVLTIGPDSPSTAEVDSATPLRLRITAAPPDRLASDARGSLPGKTTTYWTAENPLVWDGFEDAKSGKEALVGSRTRFGEGVAACELTTVVGFVSSEDVVGKVVEWVTGGAKKAADIGALCLAPPRGVATLIRQLTHRTSGAHLRDLAAELAVRRKRSIYAFVLLTSSDGRTEFACLPTPVASRNELGYHLSSAGPFAVHRYGARAAFEQDGGLVPGRKTLEAIKTGRRPKRLKSKSNWLSKAVAAMLSPSGHPNALTWHDRTQDFCTLLPASTLFRFDVQAVLTKNRSLYFNPRTERKEADKAGDKKIGLAEGWAAKKPDQRPTKLYFWLQNHKLVFRTKVPENVFGAPNPQIHDKITGNLGKQLVRLWEAQVALLQLQGLLPQQDSATIDEIDGETKIRALHSELDECLQSLEEYSLLSAHRYTRSLRRDQIRQDVPIFIGEGQIVVDSAHPALPKGEDRDPGKTYTKPRPEWGLDSLFARHPSARAIFFIQSACGTCSSCAKQETCLVINPSGVPGAQPIVFGGAATVGSRVLRVDRTPGAVDLKLGHLFGARDLEKAFKASQEAVFVKSGTEIREGWQERRR